jgi:hypothetical protein
VRLSLLCERPHTWDRSEKRIGPEARHFAQISRIFPIREKYNLTFRLEAYNVFNHPSFSSGNNSPSVSNGVANFTDGKFGEITGTSVGGRVFQGSVKVFF